MNPYVRSCVQRLSAYVPGEQSEAPGLIKLNTNENPYPPAPAVALALARLDPAFLRLYPDPVCGPLRRRIAALHGCRPAEVFVGNGGDEILALCTRAFVENDGTIGYMDPSYSLYPVLAGIRGVATRPVPLGPDFGWAMPADCSASLFLLTNPNAPTGLRFPRELVESFCRRFPGVVLIDEAYVDFAEGDCMGLVPAAANVLVLRTLSKAYGLAGIRLGYAVGAAPLVEALLKVKDSYNVDRFSQAAALAALDDLEYTCQAVRRIKRTRARLADALRARGFDVTPSETNFLWARPGRPDAGRLYEALRRRHILIRYFPGPRTGAHVRISVGSEEQTDALLGAIDDILDSKG